MKFYINNNQDFGKTTQQTHAFHFCMIKFLKGFDQGFMSGMILIDLQKAIDLIDHDILLKKLSAIGFSNQTTGWLKSYLSNQLFTVNLENCYSDPNITCMIIQGSILRLLLFLKYMNDMPQTVKSNLFLYADDSCLAFQGKDVLEIEK